MAAAAAAAAGGSVVTSTGTSVLKFVDEILRSATDPLNHHGHHGTVGTTDLYGALAGTGIMTNSGIGGLTSALPTPLPWPVGTPWEWQEVLELTPMEEASIPSM